MKTTFHYIAAATLFVSNPGYAASHGAEPAEATIRVGVGNLDLSSRADRAIFDARIRDAAQTICKQVNYPHSGTVDSCIAISIRNARVQRDRQVERHILLAVAQQRRATVLRSTG